MGWLYRQWLRFVWHVNRSPARHVVKAVLRLAHRQQVQASRRHASELQISADRVAGARTLCTDGFVRLDDVVDPDLLAALKMAGEAKMHRVEDASAHATSSNHKRFWTRLLDEDMVDGRMPTDSAFVQFAIQPAVLDIVSHALGEIPRLDYVLLTLSRHDSAPLQSSQLWHRDHDDIRVIKLFAYLTDVVDFEHGPFTFLPGKVSDRFGFSIRSHRSDSEIFGRGAQRSDVQALCAPRLSVFMVETSRCLHMGSRMGVDRQRLLYTATFTTLPSIFPAATPKFLVRGALPECARRVLAS